MRGPKGGSNTAANGISPTEARVRTAMRQVALILAAVAAALLLWQLTHVLLLIFASILLAILLRNIARPIQHYGKLAERPSVLVAILLVVVALTAFAVLLGAQIQAQAAALLENLPELVDTAENRLGIDGIGDWLREQQLSILKDDALMLNVASYSATIFGAVGYLVVVVAAAIYLALNPSTYVNGLLMLVPPDQQDKARETLNTLGRALGLWLLGQLAAMVLVGVFTTLGLWLLGVPSALALGVIAGLLEFVPLIGPIVAAVPAVLVALGQEPTLALWVIGLYTLLQQVEGYLILPLVQERAVDLPPVVTIFAILAFGALFGIMGLLLATPLAVVCLVLVKKLWVRETLNEDVPVPGDEETT
jgi:predicted PurR-regulated permease PerM